MTSKSDDDDEVEDTADISAKKNVLNITIYQVTLGPITSFEFVTGLIGYGQYIFISQIVTDFI